MKAKCVVINHSESIYLWNVARSQVSWRRINRDRRGSDDSGSVSKTRRVAGTQGYIPYKPVLIPRCEGSRSLLLPRRGTEGQWKRIMAKRGMSKNEEKEKRVGRGPPTEWRRKGGLRWTGGVEGFRALVRRMGGRAAEQDKKNKKKNERKKLDKT